MSKKEENICEKTALDYVDLDNEEGDSGFISGTIHSEVLSDRLESTSFSKHETSVESTSRSAPLEQSSKDVNKNCDVRIPEVSNRGIILPELFVQDDDGDTQLHIAVTKGSRSSVAKIIQGCPSSDYINLRNNYGHTPLHIAAVAGDEVIVRILVLAGAKVGVRDCAGETAVHIASALGFHKCLVSLLAPLQGQPLNHMTSVLNEKSYKGVTCVHLATERKDTEVLKTLVWYGANINAREGLSGNTPLHQAAEKDDYDLIKYIVQHFKNNGLNLETPNYANKFAWDLTSSPPVIELFKRYVDIPDRYAEDGDNLDEEVGYVCPHKSHHKSKIVNVA